MMFKRLNAWWSKPAVEHSMQWLIENRYWRSPAEYTSIIYVVNEEISVLIDRSGSRNNTIVKVLLCGKPVYELHSCYSPYPNYEFTVERYNYGQWAEVIIRLCMIEEGKVKQAEKAAKSALFAPLDED